MEIGPIRNQNLIFWPLANDNFLSWDWQEGSREVPRHGEN